MYGPRTQAYGETNYLRKNQWFWIERRHCMVLGLMPMGKPTNLEKTKVLDRTRASYGPRTQAYGETNYLKEKTKVLDRTKTLYGPQTQAYGETNYL